MSAPPRVIVVPTFVGAVRTVVPALTGRAPAAFRMTVPPRTTRSPSKAVLVPPSTKVPWPVFTSALLIWPAPKPVVRPVPDCVMAPRSCKVPAPEVAVLVGARMTPVPMLVAPAAPNQPVPKVPLVPLVRFSTELLPRVRVLAEPMIAPNWEAEVSIVTVVLAARE